MWGKFVSSISQATTAVTDATASAVKGTVDASVNAAKGMTNALSDSVTKAAESVSLLCSICAASRRASETLYLCVDVKVGIRDCSEQCGEAGQGMLRPFRHRVLLNPCVPPQTAQDVQAAVGDSVKRASTTVASAVPKVRQRMCMRRTTMS